MFFILEVVLRSDNQSGFVVLPRRWVVERTFAWLNNYRRLSKDYERLTETSEVFIQVAMMRLILLRLKPKRVFKQLLRESGLLVLRSSNVQNNCLAYDNNVFVNIEVPERIRIREGDILICVRDGSRDLIGKSAIIDKKLKA